MKKLSIVLLALLLGLGLANQSYAQATLAEALNKFPDSIMTIMIAGYQSGGIVGCDRMAMAFMIPEFLQVDIISENLSSMRTECMASIGFANIKPSDIYDHLARLSKESFADKITFSDALLELGLSRGGDDQKIINYNVAKERLAAKAQQADTVKPEGPQ